MNLIASNNRSDLTILKKESYNSFGIKRQSEGKNEEYVALHQNNPA